MLRSSGSGRSSAGGYCACRTVALAHLAAPRDAALVRRVVRPRSVR